MVGGEGADVSRVVRGEKCVGVGGGCGEVSSGGGEGGEGRVRGEGIAYHRVIFLYCELDIVQCFYH